MMADRVHNGIHVSFAGTQSDLKLELTRATQGFVKCKSGDIDTPQFKSLVGPDEIYVFLQEELSKHFVINSFTRGVLSGTTMDLDGDDTNCLQFMLSALQALDSENDKDWNKRILTEKLKRMEKRTDPENERFRKGLQVVSKTLGKRQRDREPGD